MFYVFFGEAVLYRAYPLLIHIPLIIILYFIFKQNIYVSAISVISAYLLCTPRKCFGTAASYFFNCSPVAAYVAAIAVTIPFLIIVVKYISPYMVRLKYESRAVLAVFLILPLAYYVLEYAFTVYTDLLYTGGAVILEFVDSFIVLLYVVFSLLTVEILRQKGKAERENLMLSVAAAQAQKELARIYTAEKQTAIYRHDLRHHMNFIRSCIEENRNEEAKSYINEICSRIESCSVLRYCKNEAVNIILSYYAEKAREKNINISVNVTSLLTSEDLALPALAPAKALPEKMEALAGHVLYVTGTGKRKRYVAQAPFENGSLIRVAADGLSYEIIAEQPIQPTSELPSHLMMHNYVRSTGRDNRVVLHTHPTDLIGMTHCKRFLNSDI